MGVLPFEYYSPFRVIERTHSARYGPTRPSSWLPHINVSEKRRQRSCPASAVTGVFYSVIINRRQLCTFPNEVVAGGRCRARDTLTVSA